MAAGVSHGLEEYYDGSDARYVRAAIVPRWRPNERVEVIPFWAMTSGRDEEAPPNIITAGRYAPPRIAIRRYIGQSWADIEADSFNYGVLAKGRIGPEWPSPAACFAPS